MKSLIDVTGNMALCFEGENIKTSSRQLWRSIEFVCQHKILWTFNRKKKTHKNEFAKKNVRSRGALCWHLQTRFEQLVQFSRKIKTFHRPHQLLICLIKYFKWVKIIVVFYSQQNKVPSEGCHVAKTYPTSFLRYSQSNSLLLQKSNNFIIMFNKQLKGSKILLGLLPD